MAEFALAYATVVARDEGGYVNDPQDRGGETYLGIARRFHPDWPGWSLIDRITARAPGTFQADAAEAAELERLATAFYRERFWARYGLGQLRDQALANKVFSFLINSERGAGFALQRAINAVGGAVACDGVIGPKTIAAANALDPETLRMAFAVFQGLHYLEQDPAQKARFLKGWLRRCFRV
jgi:lysozyme family protein